MNPTGARLHFQDILRRFEGTGTVVDKVSLSIEAGEFVALLGPSGCGKSTFLRLAAGLDRPDSGSIRIEAFGRENFRGFVFQDAHLLPWRTVLDNVALPLELVGEKSSESRAKARDRLDRVGLGDALEKFPNQLSGGMKMRASVARALVTQPTLLLLDEPFAALDENTRHRLQEDLRAIWEKERITIVFVTHSVSEAVFLANRAVVLSPRPARVILDHKVALPPSRVAALRTENVFIEQMKSIYSAFSRTGADL